MLTLCINMHMQDFKSVHYKIMILLHVMLLTCAIPAVVKYDVYSLYKHDHIILIGVIYFSIDLSSLKA